MNTPDEPLVLHFRPRPSETVELSIPSDTLAAIREVVADRDMSAEALMKFYIGTGLRQDIRLRFRTDALPH